MFFTKGGLCSLPRRVGRTYLQLEKGYVQLEKVKTKKGLCTIQNIKTKTLQMKVFQFQA